MREVITLQFGENANYVGAHFWNLQQAYKHEDQIQELFSRHSPARAVPRALVFDTAGNFGSLAIEEGLQSAGSDGADGERALWGGAVEVHRQDLHAKGSSAAGPGSEEAAGPGSVDAVPDRVQFWSDFGQARLAPHAASRVSGVEFGNGLGEMNTFAEGARVFAGSDSREDALEGGFRVFAEECDHLQGFQVLADAVGGFAGYASGFMSRIRDEYPKAPLLLYSIARTPTAAQLPGSLLTDAAVAVAANFEAVSMTVPLLAPLGASKLRPNLEIMAGDFYQASSFMAANVAQWCHCLQAGTRSLDEIVAQVTQQEYYTVAESLLAPGLRVPDASGAGRDVLAEADEIVERSFVGCSGAATDRLSKTAGQLVVDRGTRMSDLIADRYPDSAWIKSDAPMELPRAFPQIFHGIDRHGRFAATAGAGRAGRVSVAGLLCTGAASLGYLQQLHAALRSEQSRPLRDYEREAVREHRYALDRAIDRYSEIRAAADE
ncbi:mtDNA inheritance, partitioning of the mitochondrial organelle [Coemansia sp. RSA 552]|nr:mtDNA inheritance, partitioning of the mitochondrial organelle [Coemansia sp. RSA 552]